MEAKAWRLQRQLRRENLQGLYVLWPVSAFVSSELRVGHDGLGIRDDLFHYLIQQRMV